MKRIRDRSVANRGPKLLVISLAMALVASTIVTALPAGAAGATYYACLDPGGLLYNVATSRLGCSGGGKIVSWNEQGAKGATGAKGKQGRRGKAGKAGEDGADGDSGARGPRGPRLDLQTYSVSETTTGTDGRLMTVSATCDPGDLATGGGFDTDGAILASLGQGSPSPSGWQAIALAAADETSSLTAYAVCADLGTPHAGLDG